jgi:hypothetical protein
MDKETEVTPKPLGETPAASPPAQTPAGSEQTPEPSMADVAREAFEQSRVRNEPAEESGVQKPDNTKPGEEPPKGEEEHPAAEKPATEEEAPLPFDQHPRWQQRTKEYNEAKAKITELEGQLKEVEPGLRDWQYHQKFIDQYGIPQKDVDQMMNFLALVRQDPQKARETLRPLWESLSGVDPNVLPNDLQQSIKDGEITEAHAKRLWAAECKAKSGEVTGRFTAENIARQRENQRLSAISTWDLSKRKIDPDFKPKANGQADGLWELTAKEYTYRKVNSGNADTDDVRLLEEAYDAAKAFVGTMRQSKPNGRVLTSNRSSGTIRTEPKSIDDVIAGVARNHGMEWSGRRGAEEES